MALVHMKQQLEDLCEHTEYHGWVYFRSFDFMHLTANCDVGEPLVGKSWGSKRSFYFKL